MAKLVLGTDINNTGTASFVRDVGPAHYIEKTVDASGKLQNSAKIINLNGVTDVGDHALSNAYHNIIFPANTSIDFSSLTTISGNYACSDMFYYCHNITSIDFSSLTILSGSNACNSMFFNCPSLTSIDFPSLTTISGYQACSNMFYSCTNLTSIDLPSLTTMDSPICVSYAQMFYNCKHLESVKFGGLKSTTFASAVNQLQYLFGSTTGSEAPNGCTVHFPSNFDPSNPNHTFDASTLAGYPTFGGNASYIKIAFDLPATE